MALTGTHARRLDQSNRLVVPKDFCDAFHVPDVKHLFVAPEKERFLSVFAPPAYERLLEKLELQSSNRDELNRFLRVYCSGVAKVELDSQCRIRIPDRLVEFAGLQSQVWIIGVNDHAEVWSPTHWEQYKAAVAPSFP